MNNFDDMIDSRDVIARIEELNDIETPNVCEFDELHILQALAEEASGSPDWEYGEALIRDSYFAEYAEQLAEDIGEINRDHNWPVNCIDWDAAAGLLQQDYFLVSFDGEDYWIRA